MSRIAIVAMGLFSSFYARPFFAGWFGLFPPRSKHRCLRHRALPGRLLSQPRPAPRDAPSERTMRGPGERVCWEPLVTAWPRRCELLFEGWLSVPERGGGGKQ